MSKNSSTPQYKTTFILDNGGINEKGERNTSKVNYSSLGIQQFYNDLKLWKNGFENQTERSIIEVKIEVTINNQRDDTKSSLKEYVFNSLDSINSLFKYFKDKLLDQMEYNNEKVLAKDNTLTMYPRDYTDLWKLADENN